MKTTAITSGSTSSGSPTGDRNRISTGISRRRLIK